MAAAAAGVRVLAVAALAATALTACTTQAPPAGPSDSDVAEYYAAFSDARWQSMGFGPDVERPVIADVQPIAPEVWAARVADCMNGAGYPAYSEQGGGLTISPADSTDGTVVQSTDEKLALYVCQELYPIASDAAAVLSQEQLRYIHRYYVRFLLPCLGARGYEIDDVPAGDAFLEQGNIGVWNPYWGEISSDSNELEALMLVCAPMPPGIDDPYR